MKKSFIDLRKSTVLYLFLTLSNSDEKGSILINDCKTLTISIGELNNRGSDDVDDKIVSLIWDIGFDKSL